MEMEMKHKSIEGQVEVKDAELGRVRAIVARTGLVDLEGDVFLPGAFGEQEVRVSAWGHGSWSHKGNAMPVGKGVIREEGGAVVAEVQFFLQTQGGRETFEVVKELGGLQQWSYGFWPPKAEGTDVPAEFKSQGARRAFARVPVEEVSPVLIAASVGTGTVMVKCVACGSEEVTAVVAEKKECSCGGKDSPTEGPAPEPEPLEGPALEAEATKEAEEPTPEDDLKEEVALAVGRTVLMQAALEHG